MAVGCAETVDAELRGMLLAFALFGADPSVAAAIGEPRRTSVGRAWQEFRALDQAARDRLVAAWQAEAAAGVSAELRRWHPSWIDEELATERAEIVAAIRGALADGGKAPAPARELAGLALCRCVAFCPDPTGPLAEQLCALPFDDLLDEITRRGARAVGRSLAGASPALRARAMAAAGEPWAQEMAVAARLPLTAAERAQGLALAGQARAGEGMSPRERLLAVGLAELKQELGAEAPGSPARVAGRLPAALGRTLLER